MVAPCSVPNRVLLIQLHHDGSRDGVQNVVFLLQECEYANDQSSYQFSYVLSSQICTLVQHRGQWFPWDIGNFLTK